MTTRSAASARRVTLPKRALFRSPYLLLLLLLLGFAVQHLHAAHGATSDEEVSTPFVKENDYDSRQGNNVGFLADDPRSGFRRKDDVGAQELLPRMPGKDTDNSAGMALHHSRAQVEQSRGEVDELLLTHP